MIVLLITIAVIRVWSVSSCGLCDRSSLLKVLVVRLSSPRKHRREPKGRRVWSAYFAFHLSNHGRRPSVSLNCHRPSRIYIQVLSLHPLDAHRAYSYCTPSNLSTKESILRSIASCQLALYLRVSNVPFPSASRRPPHLFHPGHDRLAILQAWRIHLARPTSAPID